MINYVENIEQYDEALNTLSYCTELGLDTETTGLDPFNDQLLLLQLGDWQVQYIFDIVRLKNNNCDFSKLKDILESSLILKIGHNLVFDYKFIKYQLNVDLVNLFDTMLAEMILTRGVKLQGFGLTDVLDKYGIVENLDKTVRHNFVGHVPGKDFSTEELYYAADDIKFLTALFKKLYLELEKYKLLEVAKLENNSIVCTGDLELNGIYLNYEEWVKLETIALEKRTKAEAKLLTYLPSDFDAVNLLPEKQREKILKKKHKQLDLEFNIKDNIKINFSSPIQVKGFLKAVTEKEPPDTNEKTLKIFYRQSDGTLPEVIKDLLLYRESDKQYSTYGINFYQENINLKTGRIHASFNQLGADSGRYSSDSPNLQNIPALQEYRACFQAETGYDYICADLSQFELRVLAEMAKEQSWIDVMNDPNGDLHRFVASVLYNLPESKITKPLRTVGKTLNFGV